MLIRRNYIDTRFGQVHHRTVGSADTAAVLLHQTASSSRMFELLMQEHESFSLDAGAYLLDQNLDEVIPVLTKFIDSIHANRRQSANPSMEEI